MTAEPLEALERLDPSLVYVFVAGPSKGEGVAVALPNDTGWLVVDGAALGSVSIPARLIQHFAGSGARDEIAAYVLTHPHDDHVKGLPMLLERSPPRQVWVTAASPEGPHLIELTLRRREAKARPGGPTSAKLRHSSVEAALVALALWQEKTGRSIGSALDGATIALEDSAVDLAVRAPAAGEALSTILEELAGGNRRRANEASVVLELTYGETRIVLGGDLPRVPTRTTEKAIAGATPLATGWARVMRDHGHLAAHSLLKLPHHGSRAAWDDALMGAPPRDTRTWVVTPYTSGREPLPHRSKLGGLLSRQAPLHITHPPSAWELAPEPWLVKAADIRPPTPTGDPFADAADDIRPRPPKDALDPVWCFAFDASGWLRGRWRGTTARGVQ
jgi:hypothetical protein